MGIVVVYISRQPTHFSDSLRYLQLQLSTINAAAFAWNVGNEIGNSVISWMEITNAAHDTFDGIARKTAAAPLHPESTKLLTIIFRN